MYHVNQRGQSTTYSKLTPLQQTSNVSRTRLIHRRMKIGKNLLRNNNGTNKKTVIDCGYHGGNATMLEHETNLMLDATLFDTCAMVPLNFFDCLSFFHSYCLHVGGSKC